MNHSPKYEEMMTVHFNWKLWHWNWITPKISVCTFFFLQNFVCFFQDTSYVFGSRGPQFSTWELRGGFHSVTSVQRTKFWKKMKTAILTHEVGFFLNSHMWDCSIKTTTDIAIHCWEHIVLSLSRAACKTIH